MYTYSFNPLHNSLRKQPTFSDATNDFPAKWRLRKEERIFVTTQMRVAFLIGWKFTSTNHKYYLLLEIFEWGHFHIIFLNIIIIIIKIMIMMMAQELLSWNGIEEMYVHHAEMDVSEEGKHL